MSRRRTLLIAALTVLSIAPPLDAQTGAADLVDRMLAQVGGRDVWASARGFHMLEIMHSASLPLPAVREYWVDFEAPRIMEKTSTNAVDQLQALNRSEGWTVRNGEVEAWTAETVAGWAGFWPGIPTRVFHLLASDDPSVEARLREGNRLDIYVDGAFAVWIATDNDGLPVAYGREEAHTITHFLGRYEEYGPVRLWSTAHEPGDQWDVVMVDYDLFFGEMPVSYAPPRDLSSHAPDPSR